MINYSLHDLVLIRTNMDLNIPNHFTTNKLIEPDILYLNGDLDFRICECNRTKNFYYKIKDQELQIDYKAPFLNTKLSINNHNDNLKVYFTPQLLKYSRVGLNVKNLIQLKLLNQNSAMVHGGCIERDGKASLIISAKDMGKTSTVLSLLDNYNFMSDDLTIVNSDGIAYSYPEPLEITPNTITNYQNYNNPNQNLKHKLMNRLAQNHSINLTLGRLMNLEHTTKYNVPESKIVDKSKISKVFLLNTKSCKNPIIELSHEQAVQKIMATTLDLINPTKEPLLNFYSYVSGYSNSISDLELVIYDSIKNAQCYELNSDRVSEYARLIQKVE